MAVIELAKAGNPINNNLMTVNLPLTQTRTSIGTNTREQGYPLPDPATDTANIVNLFNTRLDPRFYPQLVIDGGSA